MAVNQTDTIKIMDTHRNDNNGDLEDLDFIDFDENIEISLEQAIFDEKGDTEDIKVVDTEEQVVENRKITSTSHFQR